MLQLKLKQEVVTLDENVFTVFEPLADDVIGLDKRDDAGLFLISKCVMFNGVPLGDDAGKLPARYLGPLSEAINRLGGWAEGNA
jgi:hypothetical protein